MEYKKRCQWCGEPYIAHKMTTLYCSKECWDKAYRAKLRQKKREEQRIEVESAFPVVESLGHKDFMTPREAAKLLGIGKSSMYRYMEQGVIKVFRTPAKTIVRRSDIEALFENPPVYIKRNNNKSKMEGGTYTMHDIVKKYKVSKRVAERRIDKFGIPKIMHGRNVSYKCADIDKYFNELTEDVNSDFYYTVEEVMEKYNMTHQAVVAFARRHNIPRKTRSKIVYYSKAHIDSVKATGEKLDPLYYTYQEIRDKFGFNKDQINYYMHTYHIERKKRGVFTLVRREDFDRIIRERMNGSITIAELNAKIEEGQEVRAEKERLENPIEIVPYPDDDTVEDDGNYGKIPGYISAEEIAERYKQNKKWVHYLTRTKRVPRVQKAGFLFYDEKVVDELFSKYTSVDNITEWYTCDDIEQKYNMTAVARRSFTHRHNIPTKKEYGITYYSKVHVDYAKNPGIQYADEYYTVDQIVDIYRVGKNTVYNAIRHYKVPSLKDGNFGVYLKTAIDKIFKDKKRPEQQ